jgi:hypothetical protein
MIMICTPMFLLAFSTAAERLDSLSTMLGDKVTYENFESIRPETTLAELERQLGRSMNQGQFKRIRLLRPGLHPLNIGTGQRVFDPSDCCSHFWVGRRGAICVRIEQGRTTISLWLGDQATLAGVGRN